MRFRSRASRSPMRVDDEGLHFGEPFSGSLDVLIDDNRVWSYSSPERHPVRTVTWPKRMRRLLDGTADVRIISGEDVLFEGTVAFGNGAGRVSFVDSHGVPIFVDKWGLIQRPFDGRREAGVVDTLVDAAREVLAIMRDECGIEGWISFGTLLGAARDGGVIGHDSDIDLCFLSERESPAEMIAELWSIGRALRAAGLRVQHRSASFLTVRVKSPDGGQIGLDVYTCFYVDDLLHETATVRASVPREAILPLVDVPFEGHLLPAPADPDTMLRVSYGPDWRVPDPSFRHLPGLEITERFDGWFGSLMKGRREWASYNARRVEEGAGPSDFAAWVARQLDDVQLVIEVGSGAGLDLAAYAAPDRRVLGLDFARPPGSAPDAENDDLPVHTRALNLEDLRDVLTTGAALSRRQGRPAIVARHLLESLTPGAMESFFRLCSMVLRGGGRLYLEGVARSPADSLAWQVEHETGRVRSLEPSRVVPLVEAAGGRIVLRAGFDEAVRAVQAGAPTTWRMIAEWPELGEPRPSGRSTS
jgi:hypothetical protein